MSSAIACVPGTDTAAGIPHETAICLIVYSEEDGIQRAGEPLKVADGGVTG